jgi:hypothetical protein
VIRLIAFEGAQTLMCCIANKHRQEMFVLNRNITMSAKNMDVE